MTTKMMQAMPVTYTSRWNTWKKIFLRAGPMKPSMKDTTR